VTKQIFVKPIRFLLALALMASAAIPVVAQAAETHVFERTRVPMRDGVELSVDIWRPVGTAKVPVILTLTPYHSLYKALDRVETDLNDANLFTLSFVRKGYAVARADVRGTYNSGGCWNYGGQKEIEDGYDLVEWLGGVGLGGAPSPAAAWTNGRVAMTGVSYDGTTANAAAIGHPPHLATIVPISAISRWYGYAYQQGARATYSGETDDADPPGDTPTDFMFAYGVVPPPDHERLDPLSAQQYLSRFTPCERVDQTVHGYALQPDYDAFWKERDYLARADQVQVPVLVSHGQLDFNVKTWEGTAWFQALRTPKILVTGQWPHALPAYAGWTKLLERWFARWLLDVPNGVESEPAVRAEANLGGFRSQSSWGAAVPTTINIGGASSTILDDGLLTESEMLRGLCNGRCVTTRLSPENIHIEGRPVLHLRGSSDSVGTHFVAVLVDTAADGARSVITRAFLNARYADGLETGHDLIPNQMRTFDLEFIDKDHVLAAGHHLELIVASSSTTWVAPDEHHATNTIDLSSSTIDLPLI
jgi:X-Pro dipeptidyl-peptidase